jgi:hypothetical protein
MAEEAEDVPVIYLHEIKREYKQGEATLTILNGAKLALWAGTVGGAGGAVGLGQVDIAAYRRPARKPR